MKPQVFSHDFAEGIGGGKTQFVDNGSIDTRFAENQTKSWCADCQLGGCYYRAK